MKRILIGTAATLALASAAFAQQAPYISGNYSSNVLQTYNKGEATAVASGEASFAIQGAGMSGSPVESVETEVVSPLWVNTASPYDQLGQ